MEQTNLLECLKNLFPDERLLTKCYNMGTPMCCMADDANKVYKRFSNVFVNTRQHNNVTNCTTSNVVQIPIPI